MKIMSTSSRKSEESYRVEAFRKLAMIQVGPPRNPNKPLTSFNISDILGGNNNNVNRRQIQRNNHVNNNAVRAIVRPWDSRSSPGRDSEYSSEEEEINVEDDEPALPLIQNDSPLDALMKMANKTFEGLETAESAEAKRREQAALFGKHQPPKKRRKSRTAFTNQQIYELEKRFLYQKYLTPADRDEIAQNLGLSNAQVITWFQNRRAKLKRDLEELKNDVTATQIMKTSSIDDDISEKSFNTEADLSRSAEEDDCEPSPSKVQRTSESDVENSSEKDECSDVDMEIHSP